MLQVAFDKDVILSPANEYEVLQLLLGECKTRLGGYAGGRHPKLTDGRSEGFRIDLFQQTAHVHWMGVPACSQGCVSAATLYALQPG